MPETGLEVEDLALQRGGRRIIEAISFSLRPGGLLEIRGPNGAGKSSLLLALAGLIGPERGTIGWPGADEEGGTRTLLHYLGHQAAIKPGLSISENLLFWTNILGGAEKDAGPALEAAGLSAIATLDAGVLSAGQARRLALARLLAVPRPVWLLDEPTSALDSQGAQWVGAMVARHLSAGGIAVIATHIDIGYGEGVVPQRLVLGAGR